MSVVECRYCRWFRLLKRRIPNREEEDGWCIYKKQFVNSTDKVICSYYWPAVPLVKPLIQE
jgi:hypothetical protein